MHQRSSSCRCFCVPYNKCLISATVIPVKIDISSLRSYLLVFPSTKTPTTVIFGNELSVCIWCPTSTPHFEILAIPPSQTQLQVLPWKIFLMHVRLTHVQQSHELEQYMYVSWGLQERILNVVMEQSLYSQLIKLIWKGVFIVRIRLLIQQIGNGSVSFNYQRAFG